MKQVLSLILALSMLLRVIPFSVLADNGTPSDASETEAESVKSVSVKSEKTEKGYSEKEDNENENSEEGSADPDTHVIDISSRMLSKGAFPEADGKTELMERVGDYDGAYNALLNGLRNYETKIDVSAYGIPEDTAEDFYVNVLNSEPSLFYVDETFGYTADEACVTEYTVTFNATSQNAEFELAIEDALSVLVPGMDDLQKILAMHDYLATHTEYDTSYSYYDAYSALVRKTAVCQGYALAFKELMTRCGISCEMVTSSTHAWNIVYLNGNWYHVDVTWDDPIDDKAGRVRHIYFLISDSKMSQETSAHASWSGSHACTSAQYDGTQIWSDVNTMFAMPDAEYVYYISASGSGYSQSVNLMRRNWSTGETGAVYSGNWYWPWGSNGWWIGSFSYLSYDNGCLWFNSPTAVYCYNIGSASASVAYTHNSGGGTYIYGCMLDNGYATLNISSSPNESGTKTTVKLGEIQTEDRYVISYDANGGSGAPERQVKTAGKALTLSSVKPVWAGHDFLGWSAASSAETAEYQSGAAFTTDANTTLYAVWKLKQGLKAAGQCGDSACWKIDDENVLTIYGSGTADAYYNSYNGARLWESYAESVTKIIVEDGITEIGDGAFEFFYALISAQIADSVKAIGIAAFMGCSKLKTCDLPEKLNRIEECTFSWCTSLTSVKIPQKTTEICEAAFEYCTGLTSITIPSGVTGIGSCAFYECDSLTSAIIPSSVTSIGTYVFSECYDLTDIIYWGTEEEWATLKAVLDSSNADWYDQVKCLGTSDPGLTLPSSLTAIEESAFEGIKAAVIYVPDSCVSIGAYAFRNAKVRLIRIPAGCAIADTAFEGCGSVMIFGKAGSPAETFCKSRDNCTFIKE